MFVLITPGAITLAVMPWRPTSIASRRVMPSIRPWRPRRQDRRRRRGGRIINVCSVAGRHGGADGLAYAASKAGIEGMTRRLAIDVGRQSISLPM